jgi:DNA polymerase IV
VSWSEPILHVDMDAFFVEVERLERPDLAGRPVVVGGPGPRGVVASAGYEARRLGIHSAMPMSSALRRCPDLVVIPPRHDVYRAVSIRIFEVFRSFTPLVEGLSLDEAFLDVSGLQRHHPSSVEVARRVKASIRDETGLAASVGVASTKFVAKLASESAKPDGLVLVRREEVASFLHPLPVSALWGVGEATRAGLARLGVETVGDLAALPEPALARAVGPTLARHLQELAAGIDPRPVVPDAEARSVSIEETFDVDVDSDDRLRIVLRGQADRVAVRLRSAGITGATVVLKVRYPDFTTVTRSSTPGRRIASGMDVYRAAVALLERLDRQGRAIRLLGIGVSGLEPADRPRQLALDGRDRWHDLERSVDEVRARYGGATVIPARLAGSPNDPPGPSDSG